LYDEKEKQFMRGLQAYSEKVFQVLSQVRRSGSERPLAPGTLYCHHYPLMQRGAAGAAGKDSPDRFMFLDISRPETLLVEGESRDGALLLILCPRPHLISDPQA
jgi:hypothetical protein